ncbi:ImmA/IrrE family metallo-endopeptidase [Pseudarthrobacter equi]|uniref:ImmA/IrrE family metallo-endopeptidase n=1 Tax=Pseudarthrobacter equi TaxID=728066 RepID=UPI003899C544
MVSGRYKADGSLEDHGRLSVREKRWRIEVPWELSTERRRFSIAHEIGHILLFDAVAENPQLVQQLRGRELWARVERLCNIGAANLLMPAATYRAAVDPLLPPNRRTISAMAARFQVSLSAVARRIAEVQPEWSVIFWELAMTHPKGAAWRTAGLQHRGGTSFLPSGMSSSRLQPDIVSQAAVAGEASAQNVLADLPGVGIMEDAWALHIPRARNELIEIEGGKNLGQPERVLVFYRSPTKR